MPEDSTSSRPNRGHFRKGQDDRRHTHTETCGHQLYKFTPEDCSAGFFAAIAALGVSIGAKLHDAGRWPNFRGRRPRR